MTEVVNASLGTSDDNRRWIRGHRGGRKVHCGSGRSERWQHDSTQNESNGDWRASVLFTEWYGWIVLGVVAVMMAIAAWMFRKIVNIDV